MHYENAGNVFESVRDTSLPLAFLSARAQLDIALKRHAQHWAASQPTPLRLPGLEGAGPLSMPFPMAAPPMPQPTRAPGR